MEEEGKMLLLELKRQPSLLLQTFFGRCRGTHLGDGLGGSFSLVGEGDRGNILGLLERGEGNVYNLFGWRVIWLFLEGNARRVRSEVLLMVLLTVLLVLLILLLLIFVYYINLTYIYIYIYI